MARKFCYRQRGHDFGPFTADEMRSEAAAGHIDRGAIVWEHGTSTGVYAKDVVGLFSGPNGAKTSKPRKKQPPPLCAVSDARVFEYVEFVFYKELRAFEEERRLGVFGPEETQEKQMALLAALRRVGEGLGLDTSHLPKTDPGPFISRMDQKYRDPERTRRDADSVATNPSEPPLDPALLGALVGSAAAAFVPWNVDPESPQDVPSDAPPAPVDGPDAASSDSHPESDPPEIPSQEAPSPELDEGAGENDTVIDDPADNDPENDGLDKDLDDSFDGVSENWD